MIATSSSERSRFNRFRNLPALSASVQPGYFLVGFIPAPSDIAPWLAGIIVFSESRMTSPRAQTIVGRFASEKLMRSTEVVFSSLGLESFPSSLLDRSVKTFLLPTHTYTQVKRNSSCTSCSFQANQFVFLIESVEGIFYWQSVSIHSFNAHSSLNLHFTACILLSLLTGERFHYKICRTQIRSTLWKFNFPRLWRWNKMLSCASCALWIYNRIFSEDPLMNGLKRIFLKPKGKYFKHNILEVITSLFMYKFCF